MTSTSFGALAKQYLREACSQGEGCVKPGCTVPKSAQLKASYLTFHVVQIYIPAFFDSGNKFANNFSYGFDTCLQFDKRALDRVQETAAELLARSGITGDAMQPGSVNVPLLAEAQPSPSCFCVTYQNRRRHLGFAHLARQPLRVLRIEIKSTAQ